MIEVRHLSAGYAGRAVLRDVTLSFPPGEVTVVLGPNGCGKSTLLRAALGLIPTMEGQVLYDGTDIRSLKPKEIARRAALLTQSRNTPSIQSERMVLHGRFPYLSYPRRYSRADREIARSAMASTGSLPYAQDNVNTLSGGQRQGVYLAMALAQDTQTVFMDEPTTYLDIGRQLQLISSAKDLARAGRAVVLVLHDLPLALRSAHRAAVLQDGQLLAWDTPEEVFRSGVLEEVFQVHLHRVDTPHGPQYYCTPKEE